MKKITFFLMALLVSLASFAQATVPTNAELWEAFKPYYNTFYGEARADQPITAVATFMTKGEKLLTDETSEYKWLGDYLLKVTNEQIADGTLKTYTGITTEVKWRFATQAFFNCSAAKDADYSGNADFTEAGKPENWGPYYLAAQGGTTPEEPAVVEKEEKSACPAGTLVDGKVIHELECCTIVQEQGESTTALTSKSPWSLPKGSIMTITPKEGVTIKQLVVNIGNTTYATYFNSATLTNATMTKDGTIFTITVTNGTEPVVINFVKASQFKELTINYTQVGGTADPEPAKYTVTATAENGTVEGDGEYAEGAEATLTATPAEGYEFVNWTSGETVVSTENPYKFTVTADVALVANFKEVVVEEPTLETVYFVNAANWTKVNAYAWTTDPNASWPGVAATKEAEQIAGYDVYSFTAKAGTYANVIFNNGSGAQTADLKWTAGKYYVKDGWYTKEEAEAKLAKPVEYESVYFVDNQGWGKANIYTWTPEVGTWPGVAMTKEAEQLAGYDVYSYTVEKGTSFGGVIFNNGSSQTGDLKWTAGKYYVKDGWYTKEEAEAKLAGPVTPPVITYVLMGVAGDWTTGIALTQNADNANEYVLLGQAISEGDAVKVVTLTDGTATAWCGNVDEYSVAHTADDMGNIVLAPGKYDFYYKVAEDIIYIGATAPVEPDYEIMPIEMTNLEVQDMGEFVFLQASDLNMTGISVMLGVYADGHLHEGSAVDWNGTELPIVEGNITKTVDEEKGDVYAGLVVVEFGEGKMGLDLTMYSAAVEAIEVFASDAKVVINESTGTLEFTTTWEGYPVLVTVAGYEDAEFKEYEGAQISELTIGDDDNWYDFAVANVVAVIKDGNTFSIEGEYTSWATGATYYVMIDGTLPKVEEPEVEKPEPTYTENNLNTYAFGLESVLSDDKTTLTVTYRLNNSNATEVNVVVYNGTEVVATVPGTTTIGVNTVEIATEDLPGGVELTWGIEVNGTSVATPTQEAKIYSFYHPSGLDIDNNPENPTFGMLLINEGMHSVKDIASGYVSSNFGAGIFAFTPSLDLIPNGELPGYNGGIEFTNGRADAAGSTAYAPRRIRISEDGRIFVTSLNTDGNYLWEVNADNMNEWTSVFKGTLNEQAELVDADSNFVAAPNNGFDVKGAGENLQLAMYSVNLSGITAAAMGGFRLHEYNLGTATEWTTAPTKTLVEGKYAINYTGTQVEYDNEGGFWIASYRGSATDANPGLVHINAEGVEDCKLVWNNVRQAGIRFNKDFTKLVVAGNNGAAKKATIYTVSKDANGAPVLTEETVIDMAVVGSNLNDFAWDYAGNLYTCGNSAEKLIGWAMPYSGQVVTPAAAKYAFQLPEPIEMVGTVKRAVQNGEEVIVLTHEEDGTAHIYQVVNGKARVEISQEGVIARDSENAGDLLAISDIAVTEDGKLVAVNSMVCQAAEDYVDAGYKRGETRFYIWNELDADPTVWFKSNMYGNWFRSKEGGSMAIKGTSTNAQIMVTSIHATKYWSRFSVYSVIDGVYNEPADAAVGNDHYTWCEGPAAGDLDENVLGVNYELNASVTEGNWIVDAELANPVEFVQPAAIKEVIATLTPLTEDLGKKYQGTSIVTVGEKVLMVAPFATPEGKLTSVEILDITGGLDAAQYVDQLFIDEAVEATAAATAVEVVEGDEATALLITLVADATIYSLEATLAKGPAYQIYEDEITNMEFDLDNLIITGGPSTALQAVVTLVLGDSNPLTGEWQVKAEESSVSLLGSEATFVEGTVFEVDAFAPSAKAIVRCLYNGMPIELQLSMSGATIEPTVVVVENAVVEIEKYLLFGDMYDYALKMTGVWHNEEDGLDYPVLVEVPVYYPEATEPSEIMSTVTVGGWEDDDPWLGFGEGTLTVTTVDNVITATGIVQNPMAGVAIDITISGSTLTDDLENVTVTVKPVKMIQKGQLIIKKGDVQYNANGAIVK